MKTEGRKASAAPSPPQPTRIKAAQDAGRPVDMPDNPAPYLTDWLFEIGPSVPNGMGETVIGWPDLAGWQELIGVEVKPWEARLLRRLSRDFIAARYDAKEPGCRPPYDPIALNSAEAEDRVANQFKAMMAAFGPPKEQKA